MFVYEGYYVLYSAQNAGLTAKDSIGDRHLLQFRTGNRLIGAIEIFVAYIQPGHRFIISKRILEI